LNDFAAGSFKAYIVLAGRLISIKWFTIFLRVFVPWWRLFSLRSWEKKILIFWKWYSVAV